MQPNHKEEGSGWDFLIGGVIVIACVVIFVGICYGIVHWLFTMIEPYVLRAIRMTITQAGGLL